MKKLLFLILTLFYFTGFCQKKSLGQFWMKPEKGFGQDTINCFLIKNANIHGQAGYLAVVGNDTAYISKLPDKKLMLKNDSDICFNINGAVYCVLKDSFFAKGSGGGSGEANTASNVGTGFAFYKDKVGVNLRFRSMLPGYGMSMSALSFNEILVEVDSTYKIASKPFVASIYETKSVVNTKTDTFLRVGSKQWANSIFETKSVVSAKTDTFLRLAGKTWASSIFETKSNVATKTDTFLRLAGKTWVSSIFETKSNVATKTDTFFRLAGKAWVNSQIWAINKGGTGANNADSGIRHLLPAYTGNFSKYLRLDPSGKYLLWDTVGYRGGGSGTTNHAALSNLSYAASGHTGFEPAITNLSIAKGGTNAGSFSSGKFLKYNGTRFISSNYDSSNYILIPGSSAQGDILYNNGTSWTRLAAGTSGYFLKTQGVSANPVWAATSGGGVSAIYDKYIRYDSASALSGNSGLQYDYLKRLLILSDSIQINKKFRLEDTRVLTSSINQNSAMILKNQTLGAYNSTGAVLRIEDLTASTGNILTLAKQGKTKFAVQSTGNILYDTTIKFIATGTPANDNFFNFVQSDGSTSLLRMLSRPGYSSDHALYVNGSIQASGSSASTFTGITVSNLQLTSGNINQNSTGTDLKLSVASVANNVWTDRKFGIGLTPVTKNLAFLGTADFEIGMEPNTTIGTDGKTLTFSGGSCAASGTDLNGGKVYVNPGKSTNKGMTSLRFGRADRTTASGTTYNALYDAILIPSVKPMTNNVSDSIFRVPCPDGAMIGGIINYTVTVSGTGPEFQIHTGMVKIAGYRNGSTYNFTIKDQTTDDTETLSSGSLGRTWTVTSGAGTITVKCNFNSSLTSAVIKLYYDYHNGSIQNITQL